jgi:hypothetical protein
MRPVMAMNLLPQRLRDVDEQDLEGDHRLGSQLQRGVARDLEMPDHLGLAIAGLWERAGLAREDGARGRFGIDAIALASLTAQTAVRPVHLHDALPLCGQAPAQACPIGSGALDAEGVDGSQCHRPVGEHAEALGCCWTDVGRAERRGR